MSRASRADGQTWDEYFLAIASATAGRSRSQRRQVGAVVVKDRHIRSTGYNGSPPGYRGSGDVEVAAEVNAILYAAPEHRDGGTLYTTWLPDHEVCAVIAASGLTEVVCAGGRADGWEVARDLLLDCGIRVRMLDEVEPTIRLPI